MERLPGSLPRLAYLWGSAQIELCRTPDGLVVHTDAPSMMAEAFPGLPKEIVAVHARGSSDRALLALQRAAEERPDVALHLQ